MNFKKKYGEYALITGGSSGIGKAIANELANKGLNLILVARKKEELQQAAKEIKAKHQIDVVCITADLLTDEGMQTAKEETETYRIGLLVPAAGLEVNGAFEKNNLEKELRVIKLNVTVTMELTHYFLQKMILRKKGGILLIASLSGHMPNPYFANYAGTKAYVLNFGASLYAELQPKGIDVTVLSPGLTKTPMTADNGVDWSKTPMKAISPEEVAQTAVKALGKKLIAIPGFKNKMMGAMAKHTPFKLGAKMGKKMMDKAINPNKL
ncbi:MAG: SDR family NAD(P)-dependent oxidoreductase [Maribacter sp.]|nr:SDR family NAD(P)-dependent oxidoreductase [Maribacter sp.]